MVGDSIFTMWRCRALDRLLCRIINNNPIRYTDLSIKELNLLTNLSADNYAHKINGCSFVAPTAQGLTYSANGGYRNETIIILLRYVKCFCLLILTLPLRIIPWVR